MKIRVIKKIEFKNETGATTHVLNPGHILECTHVDNDRKVFIVKGPGNLYFDEAELIYED